MTTQEQLDELERTRRYYATADSDPMEREYAYALHVALEEIEQIFGIAPSPAARG